MRRVLSLICASVLGLTSGCTLQNKGGIQTSRAVEQMTIAPLAVKLAGPSGYCIDPETVQQNRSGGFVLLASCHRLSGTTPKRFAPPAILTITVAASETEITSDDVEKVASGLNASQIIKRHPSATMPLFQLSVNQQDPLDSKISHQHWRGAIVLKDKLVSMSAFVPDTDHGTAISGDALIVETASILRKLNAGITLSSAVNGNTVNPRVRPKLRPKMRVNLRPMLRPKILTNQPKQG